MARAQICLNKISKKKSAKFVGLSFLSRPENEISLLHNSNRINASVNWEIYEQRVSKEYAKELKCHSKIFPYPDDMINSLSHRTLLMGIDS